MRRIRVACALAIVAILRVYAMASAHVTLVSSSPAAGSRLEAAPSRIRLEFSETLQASLAKLSIVSPDGNELPLRAASDPANAYALIAPATLTAAGTFRVNWRVVSDDGHPVSGSFTFTVGPAAATSSPVATPPVRPEPRPAFSDVPLLASILRGAGVAALAALVGLLAFSLREPAAPAQQRVVMWLAIASPLLLAAHFIAWLQYTAPDNQLTGAWLSSVVRSDIGRIEMWRTLLSLMPLWALWLARRPRLAFSLGVPALLLGSAIGHSAALHPIWSIPFKAVHLMALALWLGGLAWLLTRDRLDAAAFARATLRVSSIALIAVLVIAASGTAQSLLILPSFGSLRSAYAAALAAKVAGLIVLIWFGAHHRYRVLPRILSGMGADTVSSFVSSLKREIAVLWLVALIGGVLSYIPPPKL